MNKKAPRTFKTIQLKIAYLLLFDKLAKRLKLSRSNTLLVLLEYYIKNRVEKP